MRDRNRTQEAAQYEMGGQGNPEDSWGSGPQGFSYAPEEEYLDQPAGFTRHRSSNSRRLATGNPLTNFAKKAGGAVSGMLKNRIPQAAATGSRSGQDERVSSRPARTPRAATSTNENGDYLGSGNACRVCGKPVDAEQARCPHCNAFVKPLYQNVFFWIPVVVLIAIVVGLSFAINSCKSASTEKPGANQPSKTPASQFAGYQTPTYTDLLANLSSYVGQKVALSGTAEIVTPNEDGTVSAAVAVDGNGDNIVFVDYNPANATGNPVVGSTLTVAGIISGEAYGSPVLKADKVESTAPNYQQVSYADLSGNLSSYVDKQVTFSGTAEIVTPNEDGTVSAAIAVDGNEANIAYVDYRPESATGDPAVGDTLTVAGTVSGEAYGSPVLKADKVEVTA